jgi:hypothetical protein
MLRDNYHISSWSLRVAIDHFKISAIGCYQPGVIRAGREGYEDAEMQIAQLIRCSTAIRTNFSQ